LPGILRYLAVVSSPAVPLPQSIRSAVPNGVRDQPTLRATALALGLIPPRPMHSPAEADVLAQLAGPATRVVEIGVYEGSSAVVLCRAMTPSAELHLIDPFVDESGAALPPNWSAVPAATRMSVWRVARHDGPKTRWHIARSQDVGRRWAGGEVDFVFIDGDHSAQACREDWDVWNPHVRLGGSVAFHDARLEQPNGTGSPGPTAVVDELFRSPAPPEGWRIAIEIDTLVVVSRDAQPSTDA
jgi:predicted O-methyltransferase YrrM